MATETKTLRVLVVEDNPGDVDLVRALLDEPPPPRCDVEFADRLSSASERLARGGIDVVLLDLKLPDADGLEAADRICAAVPQTPVVVLTGALDEDRGIDALQHGAQEYLVKGSVDGRSLRRVLRYSIERKRAEDMLRRSQKLESLGVLAGGVAHDFNNMLSTILGLATLARRTLDPESPTASYLDRIVHATGRAADLTRQMLAYSGRGHFQVRATSINDLVRENVHLLEAAVPKNVRLAADLDETAPSIDADVGQLQQVLMNLVLNGAEALDGHAGTVTVRTRRVELAPAQAEAWPGTLDAPAPGRYAEIEVSDDGGGMDARVLSRLFDPFFTTKTAGRGLGLAAVLGIVRGHGGQIRVDSTPGRGSVFTLLFPAGTRAARRPRPSPTGPAPPRGLILVIDDDAGLRDTVRELLVSQGFEVISAPDGETGAALFARRRSEIQLVILDLSMPGWSGAETFRALRHVDPRVRVILSSGYSDEEASKGFVREDLAGFLQKPYGIEDISQAVQRGLGPRDPSAGGP